MGHTGTGPHGSSNEELRMGGDAGWRTQLLAKDAEIESLRQRLAAVEAENKRLTHILGVLKYQAITMGELAKDLEGNVRVKDGQVEVFFLGGWVVVGQDDAEYEEGDDDD